MAVTAALLHDVVDDTHVDLREVSDQFGPHVADIIHFVSRLSDVNQLLRRQLRREVRAWCCPVKTVLREGSPLCAGGAWVLRSS